MLALMVLGGFFKVDQLGPVSFLLLSHLLLAAREILVMGHDGEVILILLALTVVASLRLLVGLGLAYALVVIERDGFYAADVIGVDAPGASVDPLVVRLLLVTGHVVHPYLYLLGEYDLLVVVVVLLLAIGNTLATTDFQLLQTEVIVILVASG